MTILRKLRGCHKQRKQHPFCLLGSLDLGDFYVRVVSRRVWFFIKRRLLLSVTSPFWKDASLRERLYWGITFSEVRNCEMPVHWSDIGKFLDRVIATTCLRVWRIFNPVISHAEARWLCDEQEACSQRWICCRNIWVIDSESYFVRLRISSDNASWARWLVPQPVPSRLHCPHPILWLRLNVDISWVREILRLWSISNPFIRAKGVGCEADLWQKQIGTPSWPAFIFIEVQIV